MSKIKLPSVKDIDVRGKRVIVRVDLNEPIEKNRVTDDFKIRAALPTLRFLLRKKSKLFLISHRTDVRGSLRPVVKVLERLLKKPVHFVTKVSISEHEKEKLFAKYDILLLENVRKFRGEKQNSNSFARRLASWGDIYVNEDFAVSHRREASVISLPKFLSSVVGLRFIKEVEMLSRDFKKYKPLLLILGGNKFATKVQVIDKFLRIADSIFIAGAVGNTFLSARGVDIGRSLIESKYIPLIKKKYISSGKIKLPVDWMEEGGIIYDIGLETLTLLEKEIKKSKFIIWNGPVGFCEKGYSYGTKMIATYILKHKKRAIVGGGDTVAALHYLGFRDKFYFTSTGGGAMLEFLATGTLPGIEALKEVPKNL